MQAITSIIQLGNALLLLMLYFAGALDIGMLISLTLAISTSLYGGGGLRGFTNFVGSSVCHLKTYEYYDKYYSLSEDDYGDDDDMPGDYTIEFIDVHFAYPGADKKVLNGLTLMV